MGCLGSFMKRLIALILTLLFVVACQTTNEDVIKVGVITGLSGPDAKVGEWTQNGLELAKDEINSEGGINGKRLELVYEDSQFNPKKALAGAKKLVEADKVDALLMLSGASSTLSVLPYAEEQNIVLMEVICIIPACHTKGDVLFRASGPAEAQSKFVADFVYEELGVLDVGILWINNDYGINQKETFEDAFLGEVVAEENYQQGNVDFRTSLVKLASESPEALFLVGHPAEMAHMLKQVGELELDLETVGTFTSQNRDVLQVAGDLAEGHYYPYFKIDFETEMGEEYVAKYKAKYEEEPEVFGTKSYDALMILVEGLEGCKETGCVMSSLYSIEGMQGVSNVITIDDHGDLVSEQFEMKQVREGKFVKVS